MSNTVLILKGLSHPFFVTVMIVKSYWAFELVKSKSHFIAQRALNIGVLLSCHKSFYH